MKTRVRIIGCHQPCKFPTAKVVGWLVMVGLGVWSNALASVRYVDANSTNATPPYTSWATAAMTIQDAVDAAVAGDEIVVTNGIYATGLRTIDGMTTNRVTVTKPLTIRSVNGPNYTVIRGYQPAQDWYSSGVRCIYLANGSSLSGFTLTDGHSFRDGGAVYCESEAVVVSNCVVIGNIAVGRGGGVYQGSLSNCAFTNNYSGGDGGGACGGVLRDCMLIRNSTRYGGNGGGVAYSTLNNCSLYGNYSNDWDTGDPAGPFGGYGGAAYQSWLNGCVLDSNSASFGGGAAYSGLNNCTLTGNRVGFTVVNHKGYEPRIYGGLGGGVYAGTLNNCTLVGNLGYYGGGVHAGALNNCALSQNQALLWNTGDPLGPYGDQGHGAYLSTLNYAVLHPADYSDLWGCTLNNCQESDPLFLDLANGDLRLQSNSPCINAGNNAYAAGATDLDGHPRIVGGTVDIGAYEFQGDNVSLVTACTEEALRAALATGGAVNFACGGVVSLSDTIVITNDTALHGNGYQVAISGSNTVRVFHVQTNVAFTLANLTVTQGRDTNGGGIYNDGGIVTLLGVTLAENIATNYLGDACGGAVFNLGTVNATNCLFQMNRAVGGRGTDASLEMPGWAEGGGAATGGAILNLGTLNVSQCMFASNAVAGGEGGDGLCYALPHLEWGDDLVISGGPGGTAGGGAICNSADLMLEDSLFSGNAAIGGAGGAGAFGAGNEWPCDPPTTGSVGGAGGTAEGSALFNAGPAILVNCSFAGNNSAGGIGRSGGSGCDFQCHGPGHTVGGQGGNGGNAWGAVRNTHPALSLRNCSLAHNLGAGGAGGLSGGGGYHLIYYPDDPGNPVLRVYPAPPDGLPGNSVGGLAGVCNLLNTLVAFNPPVNAQGLFADLGHNLSSDDSCAFTNLGSLNNTDPKLGLLADNGGPTLTMALLPGSPAIDAGDTASAPPTDQRGVPRPYGLTADIGAFEYWLTAKVSAAPNGGVDILACGISGQECCLQVSTNLTSWMTTATNEISANGTVLFHDNVPGQSLRFYRLMLQ